jgi:uncharacterized protein YjiS (DUF1127 family)
MADYSRFATPLTFGIALAAGVALMSWGQTMTLGALARPAPEPTLEISMTSLRSLAQTLSTQWQRFAGARTDTSLLELDARTLADIGIDRSEFDSIAAEASGRVAVTRRRVVLEPRHV